MNQNLENKKSNKKYVPRPFVPKAYYNVFDWDKYKPGDSFDSNDEVLVVKNPDADMYLTGKKCEKVVVSGEKKTEPDKIKTEKVEKTKVQKPAKLKESKNNKKSEKSEKIAKVSKAKNKKVLKNGEQTLKVRLGQSIGAKLIGIISVLMCISLVLITVLVSYFISTDTKINAEDNNLTINNRTASDTENRIGNVVSSVGMFLDLLESSDENQFEQKKNATLFFERNPEIAAIILPDSDRTFVNNTFFLSHEIDDSLIENLIQSEEDSFADVKNGSFKLVNLSCYFNSPVLGLFFPSYTTVQDNQIAVIYSLESLSDTFSSGSINQSFMVNGKGEILVHSDIDLVLNSADLNSNPLVMEMLNSTVDNRQITFEEDGEEYIGAYKKLSLGDGGVLTVVKTSVILEAVHATTRRNIYLTFAILSISILIFYFFAKTLSNPLKDLTKITNEINKGNFDTDLLNEMNSKRKDEIGVLINSTKNEQNILTTFTKLTNKGVTKAIIRKEIDFEPHLKDITIFFSDIRGFTAISDGFKNRFGEKSAGEIIGFLNDYMSRMVNCIKITGGNVDKFEGDAIMACWGVLRDDSLEYETMDPLSPEYEALKKVHDEHVEEDSLNAIRATIAMRYSLAKYNKDAELFTKEHAGDEMAKYKPHIRIGAGLNSGRATVGFMGSDDKMEFTSIGDAVNLASRTESSNKPCGTDILITEDTYNLLKQKYIRCEENNFTIQAENLKNEIVVEVIPVTFEVKGKGKQHFYGIVNMPLFNIQKFFEKTDPDFVLDEDCAKVIGPEGPKTLSQVRALLGIPEPDFGGVDLDHEENKIQIQTS